MKMLINGIQSTGYEWRENLDSVSLVGGSLNI
jgi:hypothetical protein